MTDRARRLEQWRKREAEKYAFTKSIAHGNRTEPAWCYSIKDFQEGSASLAPLLLKLANFVDDQYVGRCTDDLCYPKALCTNCEAKRLLDELDAAMGDFS